jgi:hypothetical protein
MSVVQVSSQAQGADSERLSTPKLGWTLDELARSLGVSGSSVWRSSAADSGLRTSGRE